MFWHREYQQKKLNKNNICNSDWLKCNMEEANQPSPWSCLTAADLDCFFKSRDFDDN
jgi:hypothetical protein